MANKYSAKLITSIITLILMIISSSSASRPGPTTTAGRSFQIELTRVPVAANLTKLQRLSHRMAGGGSSLLHRLSSSDSSIEAPVRPGNGEFLMKLSIGTPAQEFSAIMDTGSDLTWTQCLPCSSCFRQQTPIFDPSHSSSFSRLPCSAPLCRSLHSRSSSCSDHCEYSYSYGDYSSTEGLLATETFSFGSSSSSFPALAFGCGADNEGDGFTQAAGLVGLGRGPLSLVSQLRQTRFSYCLTDEGSKKTSKLVMGPESNNYENATVTTTPLVTNPAQPSFYYLDLVGVSVGGVRLSLDEDTFAVRDDGTGGLIIDSGTTITYLEKRGFRAVRDEFVKQMSLSVVDEESTAGSMGLELCFSLPEGVETVEVPKMVFHFRGGDLELPAENYVLSDSELGVVCLAMGSSSGMSILGNVQQQNMLVVHDLDKETLSFLPTQCDQL